MGMAVKDRCEPCMITQVFEVLAAMRGEGDRETFAEALYRNCEKLYFKSTGGSSG